MALYAFDGTWNDEHDAGEYGKDTNVVRFRHAYRGQTHFYQGLGTRHGRFGKFFGGAFGVGGKTRIHEAMRDLAENWKKGDRDVDVVGFSRGAALSLHFTNEVKKQGVREGGKGKVLEKNPRIRFLGLFDVVAAFGIPINIGIPFQRINLGYKLSVPDNVAHCFHAIALDELRQSFRVTRTKGGYEVWFRGVHSDVGGGNENLPLNYITLRWMLRKALKVGLDMNPVVLEDIEPIINPEQNVSHNKDLVKNDPRKIGDGDRIHYTVSARDGHVNPKPNAPRETVEEEANRVSP